MPALDVKKATVRLEHSIREQTVGHVVAALSVVAGLAWNEAVKALITYVYPVDGTEGIVAKFLYAVAMTIAVVALTLIVRRALGQKTD